MRNCQIDKASASWRFRPEIFNFPAVFIRAPYVERAGSSVEVLATVSTPSGGEGQQSHPVLCRQGPVVVAAFHPELSGDLRVHELFLREV